MNVTIRKSNKDDMPEVLDLIKELALYEKAPHEVTNSVEDMIKDGFGEKPVFYCDVAETDNKIVGIAVYYIKYSTWKGKAIYLDDIIVTETWRGKGIGKKLLQHVINISEEMDARFVQWQVLNWNTPAINFYKQFQVAFDDEWINCRIDLNKK
jgi:ribosomal protein S18 acetylase RimI-like enzyme